MCSCSSRSLLYSLLCESANWNLGVWYFVLVEHYSNACGFGGAAATRAKYTELMQLQPSRKWCRCFCSSNSNACVIDRAAAALGVYTGLVDGVVGSAGAAAAFATVT